MKYSQARQGRVFVIRLEHGDIVHESIEALAQAEGIRAGVVVILGGADGGSRLVVGPEDGEGSPIVPLLHVLRKVHEAAGTGTLFPDSRGRPVLHLHLACGRGGEAVTGCARQGVVVWRVMEAVLIELIDSGSRRVEDPDTGFELLEP